MSNNYIPLARKYRPKTIKDVIGQDYIVKMISNSLKFNKVHYAYLFYGTRGIGKTTIARILAMSINCENKKQDSIEPCLDCNSCKDTLNSKNVDVIEFDAASKTGVDSIREIIESCNYPPLNSKYKIYIIDEVHMLTKQSFNALLKTLEEPPPKVKFIFATTEANKIPITVLSRCQKFPLKSISSNQIHSYLKKISTNEGFDVSDDILNFVSNSAKGSIRDALSIIDPMLSSSDKKEISANDFPELSFFLNNDIVDLYENTINSNPKKAISILNKICSYENNMISIVEQMIEISSIVSKVLLNIEELDFKFYDKNRLINISKNLDMSRLIRIWQILIKSIDDIKNFSDKINIEMLIIMISYCSSLPTTYEVIKLMESEDTKDILGNFDKSKIIKPELENIDKNA